MAQLITGLVTERVRSNVEQVRAEIDAAARRVGRDPQEVELLAAVKYIPVQELGVLVDAGITLVGENRAQDLQTKVAAYRQRFVWDFIGQLQSRKVRQIMPHVRLIHSLASESALAELQKYSDQARPGLEVLVEVNVAGESGKAGISPGDLDSFIERCPVPVSGLMTMPPQATDPEDSRHWFAALRVLAKSHGLRRLSMGTTQDFTVAVEEGATIVRIGSRLYKG